MAPLACGSEPTSSTPQTTDAQIQAAQHGSSKEMKAASAELDKSTDVLGQMASDIGKEQRDGAHCVMVVPNMGTGAFIVGGSKGGGVVSCRTSNDWSAPAFVRLSGVTVGLQAGGQSADLVILATTTDAPGKIFSKNFEFGAGASVAAGPVGAGTQAATSSKADFLTYAKTKGAFAGVNLGGTKVSEDEKSMRAFYGSTSPVLVLAGHVAIPAEAKNFVDSVRSSFPDVR
ncbi:MAG TPA: lipid-binding SYLF domain-containing protein [Polyangiaceae bacterium]